MVNGDSSDARIMHDRTTGGLKRSSHHLTREVEMTKRKCRPADAGLRTLLSPRRPDARRRETRLAFWAAVAGSVSTRDAARIGGSGH
jgi:hypothetical protein